METGLYPLLLNLLGQIWWPFVRVMAFLSFAPVFGEGMVPMRVRVLLALVLAVVLMPAVTSPADIDAFSLRSLALAVEQIMVGAVLGVALQLASSALSVLGYLVSSQTGLAMATLNDPINGSSSDVLSVLTGLSGILIFFLIDGHLLVAGVLGSSFRAWPVGQAIESLHIHNVVFNVGWVFAAALLLALPLVFSAMVVQIGFGFLARISPSLNLFSLGFSVVTLFGLGMLGLTLRFLPEHYIRMTERSLHMLAAMMAR